MAGEAEKDRYKNLLNLEKVKRAQKKKMRAAPSSSRSANQPALSKPLQQQQRDQQQPTSSRQQPIQPQPPRPSPASAFHPAREPESSSRPVEVPGSPMRAGQKQRQSSEPVGEVERQGREYYLRPALDSLEAAFPPRRWGELQGAPLEHNLSHLESLATAVCFKFTVLIRYLITITSNWLPVFQVLGYAFLSRTMFAGMQQEYNRLTEEREEEVRMVARYQKEVHHKKEELKGATEVLADCRQSLFAAEKEKDYAGRERDLKLTLNRRKLLSKRRIGHSKLLLGSRIP